MEFETIEWLYKRFVRLNVNFQWNFVGQELDKVEQNIFFLIPFTFQLIFNNTCIFILIFILICLLLCFLIWSRKSCRIEITNSKLKKLHSRKENIRRLFLFIIVVSFLSIGLSLWMIILNLNGIEIDQKLRNSLQQTSFELISFINHTKVETIESNRKLFSLELKSIENGLEFLTKIFHDTAERIRIFERFFYFGSIIRIFMIVFIVIYLILCVFMFYHVLKKSHWTCWKSIPFMKFSSILPLLSWIGFVFWYTKLVLLLPHAVGVCSACHDLQQSDRIYNSLFYASRWFNSTFFFVINQNPIDIDRVIKNCHENIYLWSINDLIRLGSLKTSVDQITNFTQYKNLSSFSIGHCRIFRQMHENFTNLFCHSFVKQFLHYLLNLIVTILSHFLLYLLTLLFRRLTHRWNISIRSPSTLARLQHNK